MTNLLIQEVSHLLDEGFEVAEPPSLLLSLANLFTQLNLLRVKLLPLLLEVAERCVVHHVGRLGLCQSGLKPGGDRPDRR